MTRDSASMGSLWKGVLGVGEPIEGPPHVHHHVVGEVVDLRDHEQRAKDAIRALEVLLDELEWIRDPTYLQPSPGGWKITRYLAGQPDGDEVYRRVHEAYERANDALVRADEWL